MSDFGLDEGDVHKSRVCAQCGAAYSIAEYVSSSPHYFRSPYDYSRGCLTHCLQCWLGVGPVSAELEGNLLLECGPWLAPGIHLCVMPVGRHEPHVCSGDRFANGLSICSIVLLPLDVRPHVGRRHQAHGVPERFEFP
jgi:hypothetical protein